MILFVLEGERREAMLFESIERLFFSRPNDNIVCSFGNNIYELYRQMRSLGGGADIVGVMKENGRIDAGVNASEFSDVFLFFDLDIHNHNQSIDESRRQLREMLSYFDNETENGRLYVNYPMIESIYHTDLLPDGNYCNYTVGIDDCSDYKRIAREFGPYSNLDHLCVNDRNVGRPEMVSRIRANWLHLVDMNASKAATLCDVNSGAEGIRGKVDQIDIFDSQDRKYISPSKEVAVLNGFPLFLCDYFKPEVLMAPGGVR